VRRLSTQAELREAGNPESDQMAIRVMNQRQWEKATDAALDKPSEKGEFAKLNGYSPGWVAAYLRISRQAVHQAIHRGDLDAVIVQGEPGEGRRLKWFTIPLESVLAFKAKRQMRNAG